MVTIQLAYGYDKVTRISLDGRSYDIYMKWISRDESFEMKFAETGKNPVCYSKVTTGSNLLAAVKYLDGMPKGILTVVDVSGLDGRITFEDFGANRRYRLIYISEVELKR